MWLMVKSTVRHPHVSDIYAHGSSTHTPNKYDHHMRQMGTSANLQGLLDQELFMQGSRAACYLM
jgi:hypothetical protein